MSPSLEPASQDVEVSDGLPEPRELGVGEAAGHHDPVLAVVLLT